MPTFAVSILSTIRCLLVATATLLFTCSFALAQGSPQLLPYMVNLIAGGGTTATFTVGQACPSGNGRTATDTVGDGCLAADVELAQPRYVTEDAQGNIYISDSTDSRIRRIEENVQGKIGVITTYAGGGTTTFSVGTACPTLTGVASTDVVGDGCLASTVKLSAPAALVFDLSGNLYFSDTGLVQVHKITAATGIMTLVAGNASKAYGYATNQGCTSSPCSIIAATQSYLDYPYALALDNKGGLFIASEGNQAVVAVNLNTSGSITENSVTIPAGTIAKIVGWGNFNTSSGTTTTDCPNYTSTSARGGCYYASTNELVAGYSGPANKANLDDPYGVAVDNSGNLYIANTYPYQTVIVNSAGVITPYSGVPGSKTSTTSSTRGPATSIPMGHIYGIATDAMLFPSTQSNLYATDGSNGYIWRVDGSTQNMYLVGGGNSTCSLTGDTEGDGCPGPQSNYSLYSSTSLYGLMGVYADSYSNLFVADANNNLIRELASGTQFGTINSPYTQTVEIHFDVNDGPASTDAYTISTGTSNFSVQAGAVNCLINSDNTTDCTLPITAKSSTTGAFIGTLQVTSALGKVSTFPLMGYYLSGQAGTNTRLAINQGMGCSNSTSVGSGTPTSLTVKVTGTVNGTPTGTVTYYVDGVSKGTATLSSGLATFSYTFPNGSHTIYAVYGADTNFTASTSSTVTVTASTSSFTLKPTTYQQATIVAGQSALYSFTLTPVAFNDTVTFSCSSGLPSGASCIFSPQSLPVSSCGGAYTVTVVINTQQAMPVPSGFIALGCGRWTLLSMLPMFVLGLLITFRHKQTAGLRYSCMLIALVALLVMAGTVGCGSGVNVAATPSGANTITITGSGTTGVIATTTFTLTVQ